MSRCLIGLGSNLGDRRAWLDRAVARLAAIDGTRSIVQSSFYETAAVGGPSGQGAFLNAAVLLETAQEPLALLAEIREIEAALGRTRDERWGPRTVDLDLLLYGAVTLETPDLVLPHPRMAWRRFVLQPAAEVAPDMFHPPTGWTVARLLENLTSGMDYVAIAGPIGAGKTELAERLANLSNVNLVPEEVDASRLARFYADPAGSAWAMEIEFLNQRARLLAPGRGLWHERGRPAVSDFWFDQSLAFARVWLAGGDLARFETAWAEVRRQIARPKLIVYLDAPDPVLVQRIRRRGRPGEGSLDGPRLDAIRQSILDQLRQPDQGPVLMLDVPRPDAAAWEVRMAIESMQA